MRSSPTQKLKKPILSVATLAGVFTLAVLLASACSGGPQYADNGNGGGFGNPTNGNLCASPNPGCPCSSEGEVAECGKLTRQDGEYVTCAMGKTVCNGHEWGECIGDRLVFRSAGGMTSGFGGSLVPLSTTGSCGNLCNPNGCSATTESPADIADATVGLSFTDGGGVTITPSVSSPDSSYDGAYGDGSTCRGMQCLIPTCSGGATTTLTGTVYDPAQNNPLYNAYVYIPTDATAALPPFTTGATCDSCSGSNVQAVAIAQTGADGKFTLTNVPAGSNIPLVVQMGKWRRRVMLSSVTPCVANAVPASSSRLPRTQTDGYNNQADIPKIAFVSGDADPLECILLKMGIDPSEFGSTTKNSSRRVHFFESPDDRGSKIDSTYGNQVSATNLWNTAATLNGYDVVMLACEGAAYNKGTTAYTNLINYANAGGRVFTTHYGYVWLQPSAWNASAAWTHTTGTTNTQDPLDATIVTSFPKGAAFSSWLTTVGAASSTGHLSINEARQDLTTVGTNSQSWMTAINTRNYNASFNPHFTFNTPIGAAAASQCGRVVYSDFHVSASATISSTGASCSSNTDCGFTATCSSGTLGTCTAASCSSASDCPSGWTCSGAVSGSCGRKSCSSDGQCSGSADCVSNKCNCTKNSHCGSGVCFANTCTASSCITSSDCGSTQQCNGGTAGTCTKSCTTDANCAGTGTRCVSGTCQGCMYDSDCPSDNCSGSTPPACTATSGDFPTNCRQGQLSAQEKALEFMFFDLSACISPDNAPPPPPPSPTTSYYPVTFTRDFTATCAAGKRPKWRELDYQAVVPSTASIVFAARTADTTAELATAQSVTVATAITNTTLPSWDLAYIDTGTGGSGAFQSVTPNIVSKTMLRLAITLNPTTAQTAAPTLNQWKVQYDCVDAE